MERITAHMNENEEALLSKLPGRKIHAIYALGLTAHFGRPTVESRSITLSLDDPSPYLNLKCHWFETPMHGHDYYKIQATSEPNEFDVPVRRQEGQAAPVRPISEFWFDKLGVISSVRLFEEKTSLEDEIVIQDKAIEITRKDGQRICFHSESFVTRTLVLTHGEEAVEEITSPLTLRKEWLG